MSKIFKLALCQIKSSIDKDKSMETAAEYINQAADNGASVISLPEMWNCPYSPKYFRKYAETADGESVEFMSDLARQNEIYLIGGSIPELDGDNIYNTSYIFDTNGKILGKHRKVHLFDVNIPGGIKFMESETLSSGDSLTMFDTEFCKVGVAICYDVRFPKMFNKMADEGAKLIILPASFNMTTGPAHWELLMRSRALEDQVYFAANSPARDMMSPYHSYGNSMIVNPWGEICGKADSETTIIYGNIDLNYLDSVREQIPLVKQRKLHLY
jgi:predicted amidohydrolase